MQCGVQLFLSDFGHSLIIGGLENQPESEDIILSPLSGEKTKQFCCLMFWFRKGGTFKRGFMKLLYRK